MLLNVNNCPQKSLVLESCIHETLLYLIKQRNKHSKKKMQLYRNPSLNNNLIFARHGPRKDDFLRMRNINNNVINSYDFHR